MSQTIKPKGAQTPETVKTTQYKLKTANIHTSIYAKYAFKGSEHNQLTNASILCHLYESTSLVSLTEKQSTVRPINGKPIINQQDTQIQNYKEISKAFASSKPQHSTSNKIPLQENFNEHYTVTAHQVKARKPTINVNSKANNTGHSQT
eukprot:gene2978-1960_t